MSRKKQTWERCKKHPKTEPKTKLDTSCPHCGSETHTPFYDVWKCDACGACGITGESGAKKRPEKLRTTNVISAAEAVELFRRSLQRDLANNAIFTRRIGRKNTALSDPEALCRLQVSKSRQIAPSKHSCGRRPPSDPELGVIRMLRRSEGQEQLEEFVVKHKLDFCVCPKVFVKSQWLQEPLKVKAVLSLRYHKDVGRAVSFLNKIPRWLKGSRFLPRTEKTLRRIAAFGDEVLYGCEWWPDHPDWLLGDKIGSSAVFRRMLAVLAPLDPPKPRANRTRLELHNMRRAVSYFVEICPFTVSLGPPTAADEEMTRGYERAYDDYPGDPYEDTEAEADVDFEEIDYLADGAGHFFELQEWTDEQILNLEHEKAFELEIAMHDAYGHGLFEYIPWPPNPPNYFSAHLRPRLDMCLPSPQYRDPTSHRMKCDGATKCWNALFSSNRNRLA
jgi:hypothetical protein